jgi:hypothetical protein
VLLQAGQQPDLSLMTDPQILGPLVALALLSLAPVLWRKLNGAKEDNS